jgi:tetratricopeptide (TPR) repeat protein
MARKPRKSPPHRPFSPRREAFQPGERSGGSWWREASICGLLAAALAVTFLPALTASFLHFDDDIYVFNERHVTTGLTAENWDWAWKGPHAANWHPLTTLSHMLDCQIFGLREWGHHLVNLILHAVVAMLVFLVVKQMSGRFWTSAAVAAIFAVHPLRVESVVWVAERKDLLCAVFFWATLAAYVAYARRPISPLRYSLVVFCFALALLAKPMAVSLPLVLLVLDYWPLRRMQAGRWSALLLEKLPLVAMSAALCIKTVFVQQETVHLNQSVPFSARALNAILSYQGYMAKTFWPAGLSAHYPLPRQFSLPAVLAAAALLIAITILAVALRRSRPYLLAGWLWYLGMLVPVIGLVQVGRQSMADRYTYLPQIGLLMMIVFTAADLLARPRFRPAASAGMALLLASLIVASWQQTRYWQDDLTLFQRALDCNEDDSEMHHNLSVTLAAQQNVDLALSHAQRAVELDPDSASAHANLAKILIQQDKADAALPHAKRSVELAPRSAEFRSLFGDALLLNRRFREAAQQYQEALQLWPGNTHYRKMLDLALSRTKRS